MSVDDILDAQRREQEAKQEKGKLISKALKERGLHYSADLSHDDLFWYLKSVYFFIWKTCFHNLY